MEIDLLVEQLLKEKEKYDEQCEIMKMKFETLKNFIILYYNTKFKTNDEVEQQIYQLEDEILN